MNIWHATGMKQAWSDSLCGLNNLIK